MQSARRGSPVRAAIAVMAVLLALGLLGVWRVASGSQDLPSDSGATPPSSVAVTKGHTYHLAVPGGAPAMLARGVPARSLGTQQVLGLQCTSSELGSGAFGAAPLTVAAESTTTKAENVVGSFVAPVTGRIRVACAGWGAMFVPDSNDRPFDWAGLALLLATILLTVGCALGLGELHAAWERTRSARAASLVPVCEYDQVE